MSNSSDWPEVTLKDLSSTIQYGFTASADMEVDGPRFLRITDVVPGFITWAKVPKCKIAPKDKARFALRDGDIVVARTGATVGYAKLVKSPPPAVFASYLVCFRLKQGVEPGFVGPLVESSIYKEWVKQHAGGAAQPNANAQVLAAFPLKLPPSPVQRKIASILGAYDDLIEVNRRRIAVLEEMTRRLFDEWFTRPLTGQQDGDASVSSLPHGWQKTSLGKLGLVVTGKTPSKTRKDFFGAETPFVKIPDMRGEMFILETAEHLSTDGANSQAKKYIPTGSLCVSCIGTIGLVAITTKLCQTNQQINSIILHSDRFREFMFFTLKDMQKQLSNLGSNGATMGNVNKNKFENIALSAPNLELVGRFSDFAAPVFDSILNLSRQSRLLASARDQLLPRLVTGDLSVVAAERELEDAA